MQISDCITPGVGRKYKNKMKFSKSDFSCKFRKFVQEFQTKANLLFFLFAEKCPGENKEKRAGKLVSRIKREHH